MSIQKLRFALVGAGVIGKVHALALADLTDVAELVVVVDRDPVKAKELADRYGAEATTDLDAALSRGDIDAVTVCTPSGLHADGAVAALDAGKHVVVEKPIDITLAAADRIIDAEKRSGKTVAVISQHLLQWFVGPVTDVRGTVATLALPDVIEVEDTAAPGGSRPSSRPPR